MNALDAEDAVSRMPSNLPEEVRRAVLGDIQDMFKTYLKDTYAPQMEDATIELVFSHAQFVDDGADYTRVENQVMRLVDFWEASR
jgi:hypothetical protein